MHNIIVGLSLIFCLYAVDSVAAPTPFNFTRTLSLSRLQAGQVNTVSLSSLPLGLASNGRYAHELNDISDELQPIPNAFFPKYGIVLLVLFIIVCALSSALVIVTLYSGVARTWIRRAPGRLHSWITLERCGRQGVQKDSRRSHRGESTEKKHCGSNTSSTDCNPPSPCSVSSGLTNNTKANASEGTTSGIPVAPIYTPPPSSHKRSPPRSAAHSPQNSIHSRPLSPPFSPLLDRLQVLLSTSKRMFQTLTADLTSRSLTPHPTSPNITVNVDICRRTSAESEVSVPFSPATRTNSDDANVTEVECDLGCQDITSIPAAIASVTSTQQSPLSHSTHRSSSINSRSGFYSLSGDTQLSTSTAFHSFIDLSMLATSSDTNSESMQGFNPSNDVEAVIGCLSPRYMHGLQLETIHEESDGSLAPTLSETVVFNNNMHSKISSTSDTKEQIDLTPTTENRPSSGVQLSHETCTPPRFFPAARPPPPPSEPLLVPTVQVVSALRSPERQEKRRSVAWLQPVIDWAVDHPQEDCECDAEAGSLDLVSIPDMENDAECAAALHSADAMAAVMDSLAAIGLDPTDMGLVTGEEISSSLSNSSFHATSPSLPFIDPETFRSKLHSTGVTADSDLIEEKEVEKEVGVLSGYITPRRSHQLDVSCRSEYETDSENQYNPNLYQDEQHGESIKAALSSLLSPSSYLNPGERQPEAHGKLSNNPVTPAQASVTEIKTPRRDLGQGKSQNRSMSIQDLNADSRRGIGRALSPTTSRHVTRTPRAAQTDRVYASPSSLAGLSPLEVARKFSAPSISSAGSTPSPSGKCATSPPRRPTSVSPLQARKIMGSTSSCDRTASTLASSPHHEPASPSPLSRTHVSRQRWQGDHSALGSTKSNPILSLPHDAGFFSQSSSSPTSPMQRQKSSAVLTLAPVLIERTNSMDFDS